MMSSAKIQDVSAIVVHHNSPETLSQTLDALSDAGLIRRQILVVDNSSEPDSAEAVTTIVGAESPVLRTTNRGYAAAVNDGLRYLTERGLSREFTIVATHESLAAGGAIAALREAMTADIRIGAVGPTLENAGSTGVKIWSSGGYLSRVLKRPQHFRNENLDIPTEPIDREWLDGAFVMYRTSVLVSFGFDETFFLYFEETDLHTRLRRSGFRVVWVPAARVSQRSSGIPPRLLGRNLFLFHARHFSRARGRLAVGYETARTLGRTLLSSRGKWSAAPEILSGWREAESIVRTTDFARSQKSEAFEFYARRLNGNEVV